MKRLLICLIVGLFLISCVSALDSLGTFKQNSCVEIKQTCSSCSAVNFSLSYPNSTRIITTEPLTNIGGGLWTYGYCNTSFLGRYEVTGEGDITGIATSFATYFTITPSGSEAMSSGEGLSLFGSLLIIILTGVFFFALSMRIESPIFKFILLVITILILVISVFYSTVIVQQSLGGFANIIDGYSTFFFVLKILGSLSFTIFMVFGLLMAIRYYKFKRGLID